jgi:probable addiction module antidote protein
MMTISTRPWNAAAALDSPERIALYLEAAFQDGDAQLIAAALGDAARAYGMTRLAQDTGLAREALYRALSAEGNPELATVLKVLDVFGVKLTPNGPPPEASAAKKRATAKRVVKGGPKRGASRPKLRA